MIPAQADVETIAELLRVAKEQGPLAAAFVVQSIMFWRLFRRYDELRDRFVQSSIRSTDAIAQASTVMRRLLRAIDDGERR